MNSIVNFSAQQLRRAASIKDQIDTLNAELARLLGTSNDKSVPAGMRRMSVSARNKIAAAQKARWAKTKGEVVQGGKAKNERCCAEKDRRSSQSQMGESKSGWQDIALVPAKLPVSF